MAAAGVQVERAWPHRKLWHDAVGLFLLYLGFAEAAIYVARQPGSIASIWLSNACAVAFVVTSERKRASVLLVAAASANLVANLWHGDSLAISFAFAIPNSMDVLLCSVLLWRTGLTDRFSADHRTFLKVMAVGAFVSPLAGATVGAAVLQSLHYGDPVRVWLDWYVGSAISSVALLPLALSLRAQSVREGIARAVHVKALAITIAVIVATLLALRHLNSPFVAIGTGLVLCATFASRLHTFALALLVAVCFSLALSFRWFIPNHSLANPFDHAQLYLSALLVVGPAQVVAVLLAKQRALSEILSAVGSRTDSVVVFADMAGVYRWASRARASLTGVPNEHALGRTFEQNTNPAAYREMKPLLDQAYAGVRAHVQREFPSPVMGSRVMDVVIDPARDEEGRQMGVVYCATDVTELEASRRALQRAFDDLRASNERLEQFVRIASHDLREPLNTIAQFCDVIARRSAHELSADTQKYFSFVQHGALRMRHLLDDVLQFVRVAADTEESLEAVDLNALVTEVLQSLQAQVDGSAAVIEVAPLGSINAQRSLLSLAMQNLLSNAMKFVPRERRPQISVTSTRADAELRLTIADNGIGVDPERIRGLGTPFRRLHSRRKFDGTGLGLAICKRIAEQHGGRLEIESKVGEGSVFHLVLRVAPPGDAVSYLASRPADLPSSMLAG